MVILVGEARDAETIIAVLDAAMTGHLVYTTSHTNPDSSGVGESVAKGMKRARVAVRSTTSHRSKDQCGSIQDLIEVDALGFGDGQQARPNGGRQILLHASASR